MFKQKFEKSAESVVEDFSTENLLNDLRFFAEDRLSQKLVESIEKLGGKHGDNLVSSEDFAELRQVAGAVGEIAEKMREWNNIANDSDDGKVNPDAKSALSALKGERTPILYELQGIVESKLLEKVSRKSERTLSQEDKVDENIAETKKDVGQGDAFVAHSDTTGIMRVVEKDDEFRKRVTKVLGSNFLNLPTEHLEDKVAAIMNYSDLSDDELRTAFGLADELKDNSMVGLDDVCENIKLLSGIQNISKKRDLIEILTSVKNGITPSSDKIFNTFSGLGSIPGIRDALTGLQGDDVVIILQIEKIGDISLLISADATFHFESDSISLAGDRRELTDSNIKTSIVDLESVIRDAQK